MGSVSFSAHSRPFPPPPPLVGALVPSLSLGPEQLERAERLLKDGAGQGPSAMRGNASLKWAVGCLLEIFTGENGFQVYEVRCSQMQSFSFRKKQVVNTFRQIYNIFCSTSVTELLVLLVMSFSPVGRSPLLRPRLSHIFPLA